MHGIDRINSQPFSFWKCRRTTNRDEAPSMTSGARVHLRYRDLDIPTSWEEAHPGARASRPQPYSCKQLAIQGHSLEQCTKPAFAGFATLAPSPMRARRPRSRVGVLPFTLAPKESVSGCRAAALPGRSCERASCKLGSGTGHFAGNRDVLPISIVGCDLVDKGVHHKKHKSHKTDFVISSPGNPKLIPMATR